jgi:hypothetical protein
MIGLERALSLIGSPADAGRNQSRMGVACFASGGESQRLPTPGVVWPGPLFAILDDNICQRPIDRKDTTMADRDMSGSLSKNTRKEKPSHADYAGSIVIEGRKYWLNGWVKDGEKGKFLSLSAKPAEEPKPKPAPPSRASFDRPADEEIPFAAEWR